MADFDANATKSDLERRMKGAVETLKNDLGGLRTGRASTTLLDPVTVEVYGANIPLNQVATVTAPEPRMRPSTSRAFVPVMRVASIIASVSYAPSMSGKKRPSKWT